MAQDVLDLEAARKVMLNSEGNSPNCIIIDDPVLGSLIPNLEEKARKAWEDFLALGRLDRDPGTTVIIKSDLVDAITARPRTGQDGQDL